MKKFTSGLAWAACLALCLGVASSRASAQGRSGEHGHGHGRAEGHYKHFSDHDRQEVRDWEGEHRGHWPKGFRERDRLAPQLEAELRVGVVLQPELRRRIEPVPASLVVLLTPPPPDYRYVALGDHICLVDRGLHVADILHLELNF
ncbi:MAG: hypothetical protein ACRD2D_14390 [Terriglobales bacterium]